MKVKMNHAARYRPTAWLIIAMASSALVVAETKALLTPNQGMKRIA